MNRSLLCLVALFVAMSACRQPCDSQAKLAAKVDSLEQQLKETYRPGLGEFMTAMQLHHAKLWFAGDASNWKLAGFELKEITETIDDIKKYSADRPEVRSITMIADPLNSLDTAIQQKNVVLFRSGFQQLTAACNSCHKATAHEFNVITIPASLPVGNQAFKVQ